MGKPLAFENTITEVKLYFAVQQFTRSGKEPEIYPASRISFVSPEVLAPYSNPFQKENYAKK